MTQHEYYFPLFIIKSNLNCIITFALQQKMVQAGIIFSRWQWAWHVFGSYKIIITTLVRYDFHVNFHLKFNILKSSEVHA